MLRNRRINDIDCSRITSLAVFEDSNLKTHDNFYAFNSYKPSGYLIIIIAILDNALVNFHNLEIVWLIFRYSLKLI